MENTPTQTNPAAPTPMPDPTPTQPPTPPVKKSGSNKLLIATMGILLLGLGLLGGYFVGNYQNAGMTEEKITISPSISTTQTSPTPQASPTASVKNTKTVKAGLTDSVAFKPYSIQVPEGWTDVRENTQAAGIDKLTLSKNGYTLTIYQAAMGGGGCTYPGDTPSDMAQAFTDFADIKGTTDEFRRSWNQNVAQTISYTVCYKGTDNSYGTISPFGAISTVSPNPSDPALLVEVDSMIASLTRQ